MSSLGDERARDAILRRLATVHPDSPRQWGKMSAHQMLVHLRDSYEVGLGRRPASQFAMARPLAAFVKWVALRTPLPWAKNVPTRPEVDQLQGGTRPAAFEQDQSALLRVCDEFSRAHATLAHHPHPFFGPMTAHDWLTWGYRHADHHLRQFRA